MEIAAFSGLLSIKHPSFVLPSCSRLHYIWHQALHPLSPLPPGVGMRTAEMSRNLSGEGRGGQRSAARL